MVSFAGVSSLLYFDAKSGRVYALAGPWASYAQETDPATIPHTDDNAGITGQPTPADAGAGPLGRQTLVPGFMAALDAMNKRFGRLPFADLLQPAIWYAENGVTISPTSAAYFRARQSQLWRTSEGRSFASMPDGALPKTGDLFRQPELARTLHALAAQGPSYMYTGDWARAFVAAVRANGGKATAADLARYKPVWSEPASVEFEGATVFGPEESTGGTCPVLEALNLLNAKHVEALGPYWRDPKAFEAYEYALAFAQYGHYAPQLADAERERGFKSNCRGRLTPQYAAAFLPDLGPVRSPPTSPPPPTSHSYAVIVIDRWGNIAALTHTINTQTWGDTGIIVGGIPIADAAAVNAYALTTIKPGEHVPESMSPVIALKAGKPILAISSIGSGLVPETTRLVAGLLASGQDLRSVINAPPLLLNLSPPTSGSLWDWPLVVPAGAYDAKMLRALAADGVTVREETPQKTQNVRGTAVVAMIDQPSGAARAVEVPSVLGFAVADVPTRAETPREIAVKPQTLDQYVGEYRLAPNIVATITRQGDRLFGQRTGWPRSELFADAKDHFFEKVADIQLTFHIGPTGKASEMILHQYGTDRIAPRIEPPT